MVGQPEQAPALGPRAIFELKRKYHEYDPRSRRRRVVLTLSNASLDSLVVAPHSGVHSLTGRAAPADARFAASHSLGNAATAAAVPAASERVPHCATTAASDVALAQATAKPFAPVDGSLAPLAAREDRALESSAHVPALEDAPADELDEVMLKVRLNEAELLHAVFLYELATHEAEESARALDASESAASAADARLHPA